MYQKVYVTDGQKRSRQVTIRTGDALHLREKAVRCAREWRSEIAMCRALPGDPALVSMEGATQQHLMVRLSHNELGDRKPERRKRRGAQVPYRMEYRDR